MGAEEHQFAGTDRFAIEGRLGAGAMGVVYRAYDRKRDMPVALKLLRRMDPLAIYRFKQEFRSLADVSHPNLVQLYELVSAGDRWFFTMELVLGRNFLHYVRATEDPLRLAVTNTVSSSIDTQTKETIDTIIVPMSRFRLPSESLSERRDAVETRLAGDPLTTPEQYGRLRSALRQLAAGVIALHDAGQLHRDLKPSNVLVKSDDRVVVLDFGVVTGLSRERDPADEARLVGTPAYMAPEQGGNGRLTAATDWYAVGVMLYEALTGRRPFLGGMREVLEAKRHNEPVPLHELAPEVPADLSTLCGELIARDPATRPKGRAVLERLGGRVSPVRVATGPSPPGAPLVGRRRHLALLDEAFEATSRGAQRIVLVHGSSGIGKTALLSHFAAGLRAGGGAIVLTGRCFERESVPYKALDSLIDALSRYLLRLPRREVWALVPENARALSRVFPVLRRVEAILGAAQTVVDTPDPHELRRRAFSALRQLLANLAGRQPLVLCIDDVQWGDTDSAALLLEVLRPPHAPPVLLVAAYRQEDADASQFVRALVLAFADAIHLPIERLSNDESVQLAASLLRHSPHTTAEPIAREARGNPLFVTELARHVDTAVGEEPASLLGHVSLDDLFRERVTNLPEFARRALAVVAVAGRPTPRELVESVAELEGEERAAVELLGTAQLIRRRNSRAADQIEIYHDRIRELVTAQLSRDASGELHGKLARGLEARGGDPEMLAVHFEGAGDVERASHYCAVAAARASTALAFDRAGVLYRHALRLQQLDGRAPDVALIASLAAALSDSGRGAESSDAYLEAARHADAADALEYQRRAAAQLLRGGHVDEGLRALETVLNAVGLRLPASPRRALGSLLKLRARIRLRGLAFHERDASQIAAHDLRRVDVCWTAANTLGMLDTIRGAEFGARHLLLALEAGEPAHVANAIALEACYAGINGRKGERRAIRTAKRALWLAESIDDPLAMGWGHLAFGLLNYHNGRWLQAREHFDAAFEVLTTRCTDVSFELSTVSTMQLWTAYYLGEVGAFGQMCPRMLREARARGDLYTATNLCTGLPNLSWLVEDDVAGGRAALRVAMKHWSRQGFHLQHYWDMLARVNLEIYADNGDAAWRAVERDWRELSRSLLLRISMVRIEAFDARGRAALAAARGREDTGRLVTVAERTARALDKTRLEVGAALAALLRAGAASVRGAGDVGEQLAACEQRFAAADMRLHENVVRHQRGRLVGGDEGSGLVAAADAWFAEHGVARPARLCATFSPGVAGA